MDENCFAVDVTQSFEGAQGGAAGQGQSTRLFPAEALRLGGDRVDGDRDLLSECAASEYVLAGVGDDLIADGEFRGVETESDDDSGNIPAGGDWELGRHDRIEVTADELPVDRIDSRGADLDEHGCRRNLRVFNVANRDVAEVIGVLVIDCCTHV